MESRNHATNVHVCRLILRCVIADYSSPLFSGPSDLDAAFQMTLESTYIYGPDGCHSDQAHTWALYLSAALSAHGEDCHTLRRGNREKIGTVFFFVYWNTALSRCAPGSEPALL